MELLWKDSWNKREVYTIRTHYVVVRSRYVVVVAWSWARRVR